MLVPTIIAEELKESFLVGETTGPYSEDNCYGYSGPNATLSMFDRAVLDIDMPCGMGKKSVDVSNYFPTINCNQRLEILPSMLGYSYIPSGKYTLTLTIYGSDDAGNTIKYSTSIVCVFINHLKCCVENSLTESVNVNADMFMRDDKKRVALDLSYQFEAVTLAKSRGFIDKAGEMICNMLQNCTSCIK